MTTATQKVNTTTNAKKATNTKASFLQSKMKVTAKSSPIQKTPKSQVAQGTKTTTSKETKKPKIDVASTVAKSLQSEMLVLLTQMESQCKNWEIGSYKKSNDELYQVLADCLAFCADIGKSNSTKRINSLKAFYELKKYSFNENASLAKKIVGAVFGNIDRRRIGTYAVVIEAAKTANITPDKLPAWIEDQGGIQEIRLSKSATFVSPTNKAQFVSEHISVLPSLGVFKSDRLSAKTNSDKKGQTCILLATQKTDGSFDIRELIYSSNVIKVAQVTMYKNHKELVTQKKEVSRKKSKA